MLILNKKAHFFIPASNKNMKNHVLNIRENYPYFTDRLIQTFDPPVEQLIKKQESFLPINYEDLETD